MNEIKMIPIGDLEHHPENPRKDLGDLEELTASIKANGVLQNLTVVADLEKCKYLVVIGNRRFEAAKAAGLVELPCVVSDMDHKTQVATMLEENMQRQDLTVYEQAEGFQMMMDLGFSQKEVSEKTGFSEKTVKDRLKLAKLNKKNFSAAVNRGATLLELVEVTKLDSKTEQAKVLEAAGTENFRARMMTALSDQEFEKNKKRLLPVLKEAGLQEIPSDERYSAKWERCWNESFRMDKSEDDLRKHLKKIMKDKSLEWRYSMTHYTSRSEIEFVHSKPKTVMSEEQKTDRQKAILRGKHLRYVKSFWEQAYNLRLDFVKNYTVANGQSTSTLGKIMVRYALSSQGEWDGEIKKHHEWSDEWIRNALGLPEDPVEDPDYQEDPNRPYHHEYLTIWEQVDGKANIPMVRVMVIWAVGGGVFWPDAPDHGLYDGQDGHYSPSSYQSNDVKELYDFLVEIGYQLSDLEKQLLDGTHECYKEGAGL